VYSGGGSPTIRDTPGVSEWAWSSVPSCGAGVWSGYKAEAVSLFPSARGPHVRDGDFNFSTGGRPWLLTGRSRCRSFIPLANENSLFEGAYSPVRRVPIGATLRARAGRRQLSFGSVCLGGGGTRSAISNRISWRVIDAAPELRHGTRKAMDRVGHGWIPGCNSAWVSFLNVR